MKRKVNAIWKGNGADGNGILSAQSGAFVCQGGLKQKRLIKLQS